MGEMGPEQESLPPSSSPAHTNRSRVELGKHSIYQQEVWEWQADVAKIYQRNFSIP